MPGRMRIDPLFNVVPVGFEQNPVILIKKPGEALKDTLEIDMPAVTIESNLILYDKSSLKVIRAHAEINKSGIHCARKQRG